MERGFDVCSPRGGRHSRKSNWSMATIFLSTPSARRATLCRWAADHRWRISIHALREEGDATARDTTCRRMNFYPRPPRGGRHPHRVGAVVAIVFLSTPSARRATPLLPDWFPWSGYFYPRPPRGGRPYGSTSDQASTLFLSTPSVRRTTNHEQSHMGQNYLFLSTPSARRATAAQTYLFREVPNFYPRPPRGGRPKGVHVLAVANQFLSTPSARRATSAKSPMMYSPSNFYPRPPRGGRPAENASRATNITFLSTPSARRATGEQVATANIVQFLSTPSARRAT